MDIRGHIFRKSGLTVTHISPLSGGCVATVFQACLADGSQVVIKCGEADAGLNTEGRMLQYLREVSSLPVPAVIYSDPEILIMEMLQNDGRLSEGTEKQAADAIAALHSVKGASYGLDFDTLIGGLHQPNNPTPTWTVFYGEFRLRYMAQEAYQARLLSASFLDRIDRLVAKLPDLAPPPVAPALLHGDLWGGNVLSYQGQLTGFIDPAIYYGHPEMDLAFSTLFNTFGSRFFDRYQDHHQIEPGFFEERRDLYNLYPLLVHVRLFGGSYVCDVDRVLCKFGC